MKQENRWTIDELCSLAALPRRTVRYYLQIGLLDKPHGEKRGSHYSQKHLGQLLRIRELSEAGVALERIRMVLSGEDSPITPLPQRPGGVSVRSHVFVAPGITVVIDPTEANLGPEALRKIIREFQKTYNATMEDQS